MCRRVGVSYERAGCNLCWDEVQHAVRQVVVRPIFRMCRLACAVCVRERVLGGGGGGLDQVNHAVLQEIFGEGDGTDP